MNRLSNAEWTAPGGPWMCNLCSSERPMGERALRVSGLVDRRGRIVCELCATALYHAVSRGPG